MTEILVFPKTAFSSLPEAGVWPLGDWPETYEWRLRDAVEQDEQWLQPIPYLLIRNPAGELWCYRRDGGDSRLHGRSSCGVGGHVERIDERDGLAATLAATCVREAREELDNGHLPGEPQPMAWLYEGCSAVGRVHIGLIMLAVWDAVVAPAIAPGENLTALGFRPPSAIVDDDGFELWSRLAAGYVMESGQ